MMRSFLAALAALLLLPAAAVAANCSSNPFTLTNSQLADATQVMANFNNLLNCANNNLAHNGANSDITSLSALTTPLSVTQGGTGVAALPAGNLLLGNGTGTPNFLVPGTSGSIVGSNGSSFVSGGIPLNITDPSSTDAPLFLVQKTGASVFSSDDTALLTLQSAVAPNDAVKMRFNSSGVVNDFGVAKGTSNQVLKVNITGTPRTAQTWFGTGGVNIGAPTGGDLGNGTLNIQTGLSLRGNLLLVGNATRSAMQTQDTGWIVTPDVVKYAPSAAKVWASADGTTGAGLDYYNVASFGKVGTGQFEMTFSTGFADANFICAGSFTASTAGHTPQTSAMRVYPTGTSTISVDVFNSATGSFLDPAKISVVCFGTQG